MSPIATEAMITTHAKPEGTRNVNRKEVRINPSRMPRIAGAGSTQHQEGDSARDAGFGRRRAEDRGSKNEPRRLVRKAAEGDANRDHSENPE